MSKEQLRAPRGTSDILPEDQKYWRYVQYIFSKIALKYGFNRIDTPVIEQSNLFSRGVGEFTDVVEKETYTFSDRGGDSLTLRPEGTAPVCRSYLEHGMQNLPQPVRLFYQFPMYRYERPQAGRYREFRQAGIEVIGEHSPIVDLEVIQFAWELVSQLGLSNLDLIINSIGDEKCRDKYITDLKLYYTNQFSKLDHPDCQRRLDSNTLRLLDCKNKNCQELIKEAPRSLDYLCEGCLFHWNELLEHLDSVGIPYRIDDTLVRGFDYYTKTVFEIVPENQESQNTILAGGRYDGLIEQIGGQPTPGIGFAIGLDRVIMNLKSENKISIDENYVKCFVAHNGEDAKKFAVQVVTELRNNGIRSILGSPSRSLKSQMRYASSIKALNAIIIGEDELKDLKLIFRNMLDSNQEKLDLNQIIQKIKTE
ncbi:MAG: histidine--tRNA ligase [SAR202 cluster bacterium]|nr:histidine--tRNA ligase [SAR202 cluster bacterium]|tara:strand:+ start:15568 stop:16836 length:1269 start_codon:yes stop_codon:yes gene_type:complete